jgi:C4-dicarboxylate transporter/malic acid transport protein
MNSIDRADFLVEPPIKHLVFRDLARPLRLFSHITPNWFGSVMGTGVVANAAVSLPLQFFGLRAAAITIWAVAAILLVLLLAATAVHWIRFPRVARSHHLNPVMAHFYGSPPMALLTVGASTLLAGQAVIGLNAAVIIDEVLWSIGTGLGLASAIAVPYLLFTRHEVADDSAFGGWLMPIVPPLVSASTGALLIPYVPPGQGRLDLLLGCYAMFGLGLIASLVVIVQLWSRLTRHSVGTAAAVPTLWIVLGPLGQSITAANLLGGNAHLAVNAELARGLELFGVIFGVPTLGFAMLWAALATAITVGTARSQLPFSLTWWSFIFAIGSTVTGLSALALHAGSVAIDVLAVAAYAALVIVWLIVASRTFHASVIRGSLFLAPAAPVHASPTTTGPVPANSVPANSVPATAGGQAR